jgi:hypothetical protein
MPNRNYITGRRFEYKVRDTWRSRGYTAFRSAGSHSPYDVVALQPCGESSVHIENHRGIEYRTIVTPITGYAIQCKRRKLPTPKPARAKQSNHSKDPRVAPRS